MNSIERKPQNILENIVTYFCFKANPMSTRKLIKLVFLVDVYHQQMFGERLTDVGFVHYKYGPWSPDIEQCVEELVSRGILEEKVVKTSSGFQATIPKPAVSTTTIKLKKSGMKALEMVINDCGDKSPDDVVNFAKSTVTFLSTKFGEEIDFTRIDAVGEYAKRKGVSKSVAATRDVLLNENIVNALEKAKKTLKSGGRLYTYDEIFTTS